MARDLRLLLTILGMGIITYLTRAGGLWAVERLEVSDRTETALEALPGAILISLVAPTVVQGGVPEWVATGAVLLVAVRTGSILLAMGVGIGVVWLFRTIHPVL